MNPLSETSLITAIKTPYRENGTFDLMCYDKLVERQIQGGVQGLVVGGTTGEGHLMSWDEHIMLIAHTVNQFGNKIKVIGNTGSNNTKEALKATEQGFAVGMHCALQINPYYGKTSSEGLLRHLDRLLDLGPALIYNVPSRTNQDIGPEIIETLAKHPRLVGVKECAGSERIGHYEEKGIACWSGNDDQCHDSRHNHGSHGVVSVLSNILPKTMKKLMEKPDPDLNQRLQPLIGWLFSEPNPIPLNTLMAMAGMVSPIFRLPYVPLSKSKRAEGIEIIRQTRLEEELGDLRVMEDREFLIL